MKIKIIFFKNYSTKSKNKKKSYLKRTLNLFVTIKLSQLTQVSLVHTRQKYQDPGNVTS